MGEHILIIEDDQTLREGLVSILSDEQYEVKAFPDGNRIRSILKSYPADLCIIDYRLPGIDGLTITRLIRNMMHEPYIPILIISASGQNLEEEATKAQADGFLRKPFEVKQLSDWVKRALAKRN